jgi:hypothetical protein
MQKAEKKTKILVCLRFFLIDILSHGFSFRHGRVGAKRLVTTAFVAHRVYQVQHRANGKKKEEAGGKDGKDDEQDEGPCEAFLG